MPEERKIRRQTPGRCAPAVAAALLASVAAGPLAQGQASAATDSINSARPLLDLARLMEQRYLSPVTYEDPMWEFQGDLELLGSGNRGLFPAPRAFTVPAEVTEAQGPKLDAATLGRAVASYHSQTDGPRYRVATSRLGLHLIPDQVRGPDGKFAAARNALDTVVSIPTTLQSPSQHLADLCAELSKATGARIVPMGPGGYPLEQIYMPNGHIGRYGSREDMTVAWGAQGISAREALIGLLAPSATSLNWHFICRADRFCFIQVDAMKFSVVMPSGQAGWADFLYDRCAACPKLGVPPPPLNKR